MTLERAALPAMAAGLFLMVQPWFHFLFTAGFPLALAGVIGYHLSARFGSREENGP